MTYSNDFTAEELDALAQAGDYSNPNYRETPDETARRWTARSFTARQAPPLDVTEVEDRMTGVVYQRVPGTAGWRGRSAPSHAVPVEWPLLFHASDHPLYELPPAGQP